MPRPLKPLFEVLKLVFRHNDTLYRFLSQLDYSNTSELLDELPGVAVPRGTFTMAAVEQMQAHGVDDEALFDTLAARFSQHRDTIQSHKREYLSSTSLPNPSRNSSPSFSPVLLEGRDGVDRWHNAFERIMEDRPTFLDISFLKLGLQRAQSVAKIRMNLSGQWFTGTAFLVQPDLLLTAHHNLWEGDDKATEVEVIFDYDRAICGRAPEGVSIWADPDSFAGNKTSDWALLRLPEPQLGRPTAPLSTALTRIQDRVSIIQHPLGAPKQIALHHNLVTFADDTIIQYLTDTMKGSSGSPVFNQDWEVVAIHQKGGELDIPGSDRIVFCNQGANIVQVRREISSYGVEI